MHNGGIADFHLIKRRLQAELSDDVYNVVQGNTGERNMPADFKSRLYLRRL
jgi:glutamine amidotransferase